MARDRMTTYRITATDIDRNGVRVLTPVAEYLGEAFQRIFLDAAEAEKVRAELQSYADDEYTEEIPPTARYEIVEDYVEVDSGDIEEDHDGDGWSLRVTDDFAEAYGFEAPSAEDYYYILAGPCEQVDGNCARPNDADWDRALDLLVTEGPSAGRDVTD